MGRIDPVERVLNLLALLHESSQPLTRAEIAARLARGATPYATDPETLHQQFSADRRTLTLGLGTIIHQRVRGGDAAGQTEYWIDPAEVRLPAVELAAEEHLVVALALAAVRRSLPLAGEAALKLTSMWTPSAPIDFVIDLPDPVVTVMQAAKQQQVVAIADSDMSVMMEPWAVVLARGSWRVWGWIRPSDRSGEGSAGFIRLDDRHVPVLRADLTRQAPTRSLEEVDLAALFAPGEAEVAQIEVDEIAAVRAAMSPQVVGHTETPEGVLLDVRVDDPAALRTWLVSLGPAARLIGPEHLVTEFRTHLEALAEAEPSGRPAPARPATPGRRRGPEPVVARLHRLLAIVPWLYQQESVPVADIARQVGASVAQVVRDLTLASMCGVPPYTADLLFGFWVEPDPVTSEPVVHVVRPTVMTSPLRLSARQAAAVSVALNALAALPGEGTEVVETVRTKLSAALGDHPVQVMLEEPTLLARMREAVQDCERVRITYVDLEDALTDRVVDPLKLFIDRGNSYVFCDDQLRGAERVFRVDRIVAVETTGERFEPREIPVPAGAVWEWMIPDREVVVRLPPGSDWVLDRFAVAAHVGEPDGSLVVWLSVVSQTWLTALLLACGGRAEVITPEDLRRLPAERARALLERYR